MTFGLSLYRMASGVAAPFVKRHLNRRVQTGKEDLRRLGERLGTAPAARPDGALVWIHAASIGEALSALPLAAQIEERGARCLMTTGTVTSAALLAKRCPALIHRFVPVDTPAAVAGFLDGWRPDAALWMESEIWPNLVQATAARKIPMALVNARLSTTSRRNWGFARQSAEKLLNSFSVRLAQTEEIRDRLVSLGAESATTSVTGDLKASRAHEPVDATLLDGMRRSLEGRPVWLAASTHPGDEAACLDAHVSLGINGLCTIIVPRHPERAGEIVTLAKARNLSVTRRSSGQGIEGDVYVADTLGELALWYALAPVALIGGGWEGIGGHNPLEATPHDCAILSGGDVPSFNDVYARLSNAGAAMMLDGRDDLSGALAGLIDANGATRRAQSMAQAARPYGVPDPAPLARTMAGLAPLLTGILR